MFGKQHYKYEVEMGKDYSKGLLWRLTEISCEIKRPEWILRCVLSYPRPRALGQSSSHKLGLFLHGTPCVSVSSMSADFRYQELD